MTRVTAVTTRIVRSFEDPSIGPDVWSRLLGTGPTDTFDLTWPVQRAWWETCGQGELLLVVASRGEDDVAIAPLSTSGGMVFNLASKDRLDFVGDVSDPEVLDALLQTARDAVPDVVGFRLYFIADESPTGDLLRDAAGRIGLVCVDEGALPAPALHVASDPAHAEACTRKQSLRRHEAWFRRNGELVVHHIDDGDEIRRRLPAFYEQHIGRRGATEHPSLFVDRSARAFYERMTDLAADTGWLRFTEVRWGDRPIAFHYGSSYRGRYLYGIPSFAIDLADHSPGEVLLRQLLLAAIEEGVEMFDFGVGDEQYKYRFATHETTLRTWGLYPR